MDGNFNSSIRGREINEIWTLKKKLEEKVIENKDLKEMCLLDNQIIHELEGSNKELKKEIRILKKYK